MSPTKSRPEVSKRGKVYYVDGKPIHLNLFESIRVKFMSAYERQAFLAAKLLEQERKTKRKQKTTR